MSNLIEGAVTEALHHLDYAEAIGTLINNVASTEYKVPAAMEEQRKQIEVLAEAQNKELVQTRYGLTDVLKATRLQAAAA
jgi:hypothetical protein